MQRWVHNLRSPSQYTPHTTLHLGSRTELQVVEARTLDHRLKQRISLVTSAAEGQRFVGVRQELQVLGRLGLLLVEVVGAEAGIALVDEDDCLLACNGFADLELTYDGWISNQRVVYYETDRLTERPHEYPRGEEEDERARINDPLPHPLFGEIRCSVVVPKHRDTKQVSAFGILNLTTKAKYSHQHAKPRRSSSR